MSTLTGFFSGLHLGWWSVMLFLLIVGIFTGAAALNLRVG